ncbi:MAG: 1-(5-phosphoribosyl)-5-[(5-phosphoribosylamino)methylideneamino]imidazole-4-carboxamide isomerase [Actinomycetota bacterium]|nr:1-(5-phosphoribosyl)-5-[(5-phosphoribosylamino)methylideneamino]imidazole-4-carboxamide isomerase [Actinomycetota bacterium]
MFQIYPAVDIKDGKCVRLCQGDPDSETVFSDRPWEMARHWEDNGASFLHVVDLDGASRGLLVNIRSLEDIMRKVSIPVQVGGGVRSIDDVERLLRLGVSRVILGTKALLEPDFLSRMIRSYGGRVIVSLDTRGVELAAKGWGEKVHRTLKEVVSQLVEHGAERAIHTDIARDGTLRGRDQGVLEPLLDRGIGIIAAGGITSVEDVAGLKALMPRGLEGAIIGRALYSGGLELTNILPMQEK